jgi:hypothetical protein
VHLAVQDPSSAAIQIFRDGGFHDYQPEARQLPRAASCVDWYRGWRDHLEFAEIDATDGSLTPSHVKATD